MNRNPFREEMMERYELAIERIGEITGERWGNEETQCFEAYFSAVAEFLLLLEDNRGFLEAGGLKTASLEELQRRNRALYEDVLEENYEKSYANPAYAVAKLGDGFGALLAFLYAEMRSMIGFLLLQHIGIVFLLDILQYW